MVGLPDPAKPCWPASPDDLPDLQFEEAIEITKIYSVAGLLGAGNIHGDEPFRSPHHTISDVGLIAAASSPPGECQPCP